MEENKKLKWALWYLETMKFSVIPIIPGDKKPMISWQKYQKERATREQVIAWWTATPDANVGVVTGAISDLGVIDIDSDEGRKNIEPYINDSFLAPTVDTPRGGMHYYCRHKDGMTNKAGAIPGTDFRGEGGYVVAPPSVNGNGKGYKWEPDLKIGNVSIPQLPELYFNALLKEDKYKIYTHGVDKNSLQVSTASTSVYIKGRRDQDLFTVANALVKQRCDDAIIYKTLEILALNCQPPFPLNEAEIKIKSAIERANRRERNLAEEVREWVLSTSGVFLSTDVVNGLQLSTREEKKNLSIILKRLEKNDKLIQKHGTKNGCYRAIDQEEEVIDFLNADLVPYDIRFPLGIQEFVAIHKGNVIILAGESNAGKSAFCLNVAKSNCKVHPVNYMSSEMQDGAELRVRINKFGESMELWKKVKFTFRTDNFPDKIDPDGLNIIDYLDEGTDSEAYKMPMRIRLIADRLKGGVAVIAIQKDPNKGLGFGGSGTMNRSRLYVTISRGGIMKIEKGKMWRNDLINPNGMYCKFKLVGGAKFIKDDEWRM